MHTIFHAESESEVEKKQILEPVGKSIEKPIPGYNSLSKMFSSILLGVVVEFFFKIVLKMLVPNMLIFPRYLSVLKDLERSGRLVGQPRTTTENR